MTNDETSDKTTREAAGELSVEYPVSEAERHAHDRLALYVALFGVFLIGLFAWLTHQMLVWEYEVLFAICMFLTLLLAVCVGGSCGALVQPCVTGHRMNGQKCDLSC